MGQAESNGRRAESGGAFECSAAPAESRGVRNKESSMHRAGSAWHF